MHFQVKDILLNISALYQYKIRTFLSSSGEYLIADLINCPFCSNKLGRVFVFNTNLGIGIKSRLNS